MEMMTYHHSEHVLYCTEISGSPKNCLERWRGGFCSVARAARVYKILLPCRLFFPKSRHPHHQIHPANFLPQTYSSLLTLIAFVLCTRLSSLSAATYLRIFIFLFRNLLQIFSTIKLGGKGALPKISGNCCAWIGSPQLFVSFVSFKNMYHCHSCGPFFHYYYFLLLLFLFLSQLWYADWLNGVEDLPLPFLEFDVVVSLGRHINSCI